MKRTIATNPGQPSLHVEFTSAEKAAREQEELENIAAQQAYENHYTTKRVAEYPPIEEQLDMLYKDIVNGTATWTNKITEIKTKYPKN